MTATKIRKLTEKDEVDELARLLGGAEITEKATGKCRGDETSGRGDEESQSCTSNSGMNRQNEKKLTG